ncbi:MAG: RidA family protein [Deltaproteobacteria bacterium]
MSSFPWLATGRRIAAIAAVFVTFVTPLLPAQDAVRAIDSRDADGSSAAVVVPNVPLVQTTQLLPFDEKGELVGKGVARTQIDAVLDRVETALRPDGNGPEPDVVKLNVVVANDEIAGEVRKALARRFQGGRSKPAVSFVVGKLRHPGVLVAIDALAVVKAPSRGSERHRVARLGGPTTFAHVATLKAGPKVYVAGQAEKGKDVAEMTRRTMESLAATLKHLGLTLNDVVQVKSFVGPITTVDDAEREIAAFFKDESLVPPLAFVEWTTSPSIEIEIVAAGHPGDVAAGETVDFLTPPGMTASPVFSRVARMSAGPTIYLSGLYGASSRNGEAETLEIFTEMEKLLEKTGSDFRHLVKATYYVASDEASAKLNELRPRFYDPRRPPSASKAPVAGTGLAGKTITLDMIAAPRTK